MPSRATNSPSTRGLRLASVGLAALIAVGASLPVRAQPVAASNADSARAWVKKMTDYVDGHKTVSSDYDAELEIITPDIEKLTFAVSGTLQLSRPDRIHATRTGGFNDVEFAYDGKTMTVYDRANNVVGQTAATGTIEAVVDRLENDFNVNLPAMSLLRADAYAKLMDGAVDAKDIGPGVVNGVECEHLAFRNADTDWQLWVRTGAEPTPCMYVITSKTVAAGPQYRIRIYNFKVSDGPPPASIDFQAPAGAKRQPFSQMTNLGVLPPPAPFGGGNP